MKKIMGKAMILVMALIILTPVLAFSMPAFAEVNSERFFNQTGGSESTANRLGLGNADLPDTIINLIGIIMGFLGLIAVVIILIGGFKWMTAGGNEDKVGEAKKLIIAGIIGLIVILFAYALVAFVLRTLVDASTPVA